MSIKNLPMNTYLSSKISIQAAFISEIRLIKEEAIRLQLEAYRLELQEELRIAVEEFRVAQAALLEAAAEEPAQSDVPVEEPITEAEFIEKLEKLNEEKLEALNKELHNTLKKEMAELQLKRSSELILAYGSQFQLDRVASLYSDFFKEPAFIDSLLNSVLLQRNHSWYNLESFLNNLPKNAFVDPLVILFLLRINYSTLKTFEKFRKVKIRKFKMKRRKVRKLYVFRKLKKIVLFRKIKKKLFQVNSFNDQFELTSSRSSRNILVQRIPVSTRVIEAASVDFFYKLNKKKNRFLIDDFDATVNNEPDLLIYLRNYHQKPYHKLRKARIAHWGLFFNKTLRKQRYKGFINRFVKKPNKLSYVMNYFVNVFTKMKFSWTRVDKLESFFKLYFVEYSRNIVRIPMIFANFFK